MGADVILDSVQTMRGWRMSSCGPMSGEGTGVSSSPERARSTSWHKLLVWWISSMRWSARVPIVVDCCRMKPFVSCSRLSVPHFPGNHEGVGRTIVGLSARHQGASQQRRRRGGGTHHRPISLTPGVARHGCGERLDVEPPRLIDLSLLPHVSVVDTVEPPALERVSFEPVHAAAKVPATSTNVSDQFAALLESLDAIAGVIQAAVDQPAIRPVSPRVSSESEPVDATIPVRREILGLFVLEARSGSIRFRRPLERLDTTSEQARRSGGDDSVAKRR